MCATEGRVRHTAHVVRHFSFVALVAAGCHLHPSNNDGGAINLAASGDVVFVARGCDGLEVVDGASGEVLETLAASGESDSYDDLSVADGLLFVLDADDGYLTTFAIGADGGLTQKTADVEVEVGPYSGVSAAGSAVVVSGGTSEMTFLSYTSDGGLSETATLEGHRGHPDVALDPAGTLALVSTHFSDDVDGHEFGVVSAALSPPSFSDEAGLPGAGFTEGGGTPASWPARAAFGPTHAFVAHGGGLSVLSTDASRAISVVTTIDVGIEAVDVTVAGDRAYVVGSSPTPRVVEIDVADPAAPSIVRTFDVSGEGAAPTAVLLIGENLFVAAGEPGLVRITR